MSFQNGNVEKGTHSKVKYNEVPSKIETSKNK